MLSERFGRVPRCLGRFGLVSNHGFSGVRIPIYPNKLPLRVLADRVLRIGVDSCSGIIASKASRSGSAGSSFMCTERQLNFDCQNLQGREGLSTPASPRSGPQEVQEHAKFESRPHPGLPFEISFPATTFVT